MLHYFKLLQFVNELKKICFPSGKTEFWAHGEFRTFGLKKGPEYLYRLFDVSPKQTTCEIKISQVDIQKLFRD